MIRLPRTTLVGSLFLLLICATCARGAEPLHTRIDRLIAAGQNTAAERTSDAEFLRRITLDFAGRIPSAAETRRFLADKSPDKRRARIDVLLNGPEYPRRMRELFHVMLMERRGTHAAWDAYLQKAFAENRPWDSMAREMLSPNADDPKTRGAAFFLTKRLEKYGQNPVDFPGLTRDVGRLFLGIDLQCAQCHDHIHIADYKQAMYQGLYAFVGTATIRRDTKFPAIAEKPLTKKVDFMSVFVKEPQSIGPRVPGDKEIVVPVFKKGEEYAVKPDRRKRTPGVLKFSPLKKLGERLPRKEIPAFARNMANRLWWVMMGRGLVEPLDLHHSQNPPSHPELLKLLADEFVAHRFDIKYLLREFALSDTYQRSTRLSPGAAKLKTASYAVAHEKALSAEQLLRSVLQATGEQSAPATDKQRAAADKRFAALEKDFVSAFGNTPRDPEVGFNPSVKSALFVSNSPKVLALLKPQPGNLVDRLTRLKTAEAIAEELYLAVLARKPEPEEVATVAEHLQSHGQSNPKAIGQLVWALLASTEFCLNH